MTKFRSLFAGIAFAIGVAVSIIGLGAVGGALLTACGTGAAGADPSASSPASSHYKADLAAGYDAIAAVRIGVLKAAQAHAITVTQAEAVQTQCKAFTATLDTLRAGAATSTNQTMLTATLLAISAATAYTTISQGVPKS